MDVEVLKVIPTDKWFNVVHVCVGRLYGDCISTVEVDKPGNYWLRTSLQVKNGRLTPLIRVEPKDEKKGEEEGISAQVLKVTLTNKGFNIVHACVDGLYGDCLATTEVDKPGDYWLRTSLQVKEGRLTPLIRVEPKATESAEEDDLKEPRGFKEALRSGFEAFRSGF